jgi:hypothetical protein
MAQFEKCIPSAAEAVIENKGFYRSAEALRHPKASAKMRFSANRRAEAFQGGRDGELRWLPRLA